MIFHANSEHRASEHLAGGTTSDHLVPAPRNIRSHTGEQPISEVEP